MSNQQSKPARVTPREMEILPLICDGMTNGKIAEKLFISEETAAKHRKNIMKKAGVSKAIGLKDFYVEGFFLKRKP